MPKVAIVGATGAVGEEMRKVLEEKNFPLDELRLLASERSAGKSYLFRGEEIQVEQLENFSFEGIDIALFSAGSSISKKFAPKVAEVGAVVIDNSSAFRMEEGVPLVVPEVNPDDVQLHQGIIANPNCSTIQMVVVLKPIYDYSRIKRIVVSTYQSVSGTGREAMGELMEQTKSYLEGKELKKEVYPHQIAFNLIPHIDEFLPGGYTREEMKMANETKKILHDERMAITATTVRVPVLIGHSEAVNIETEGKISAEQAREILKKASGVEVIDDPENNLYPLPFYCQGKDPCYVGRIRKDDSIENGLNLWIVADNLRKGAALNAVQIAELL